MSDMVERVGRAMMLTRPGKRLVNTFTDDEIREFARAAVEAMAPPQPTMDQLYPFTRIWFDKETGTMMKQTGEDDPKPCLTDEEIRAHLYEITGISAALEGGE